MEESNRGLANKTNKKYFRSNTDYLSDVYTHLSIHIILFIILCKTYQFFALF